jgi:hypothetical protein
MMHWLCLLRHHCRRCHCHQWQSTLTHCHCLALSMLFRTCPLSEQEEAQLLLLRFLMGAPTMCMTRFCPT